MLREIETRAGAPFAEIGMREIADDDPPSLEELEQASAAQQLWVSVDEQDVPWAYLLALEVDGCLHVEQVSVDPRGARRGLGRELIDHLSQEALRKGLDAVTLTTFRDVPWNAPYYERLGFRSLEQNELGSKLAALRQEEKDRGLDRWPRVAMRRELAAPSDRGETTLEIRSFVEEDQEAVVALWQRCDLVRPWNDPRRDIARKLQVQRDLFLVGELEGEIVASAMVGYDGHRGWINYLAVDPKQRRRGYGRDLMAAAEERLRELGCPKINLQVRSSNTAVVDFYDRIGFARDDVVSFGKRLVDD